MSAQGEPRVVLCLDLMEAGIVDLMEAGLVREAAACEPCAGTPALCEVGSNELEQGRPCSPSPSARPSRHTPTASDGRAPSHTCPGSPTVSTTPPPQLQAASAREACGLSDACPGLDEPQPQPSVSEQSESPCHPQRRPRSSVSFPHTEERPAKRTRCEGGGPPSCRVRAASHCTTASDEDTMLALSPAMALSEPPDQVTSMGRPAGRRHGRLMHMAAQGVHQWRRPPVQPPHADREDCKASDAGESEGLTMDLDPQPAYSLALERTRRATGPRFSRSEQAPETAQLAMRSARTTSPAQLHRSDAHTTAPQQQSASAAVLSRPGARRRPPIGLDMPPRSSSSSSKKQRRLMDLNHVGGAQSQGGATADVIPPRAAPGAAADPSRPRTRWLGRFPSNAEPEASDITALDPGGPPLPAGEPVTSSMGLWPDASRPSISRRISRAVPFQKTMDELLASGFFDDIIPGTHPPGQTAEQPSDVALGGTSAAVLRPLPPPMTLHDDDDSLELVSPSSCGPDWGVIKQRKQKLLSMQQLEALPGVSRPPPALLPPLSHKVLRRPAQALRASVPTVAPALTLPGGHGLPAPDLMLPLPTDDVEATPGQLAAGQPACVDDSTEQHAAVCGAPPVTSETPRQEPAVDAQQRGDAVSSMEMDLLSALGVIDPEQLRSAALAADFHGDPPCAAQPSPPQQHAAMDQQCMYATGPQHASSPPQLPQPREATAKLHCTGAQPYGEAMNTLFAQHLEQLASQRSTPVPASAPLLPIDALCTSLPLNPLERSPSEVHPAAGRSPGLPPAAHHFLQESAGGRAGGPPRPDMRAFEAAVAALGAFSTSTTEEGPASTSAPASWAANNSGCGEQAFMAPFLAFQQPSQVGGAANGQQHDATFGTVASGVAEIQRHSAHRTAQATPMKTAPPRNQRCGQTNPVPNLRWHQFGNGQQVGSGQEGQQATDRRGSPMDLAAWQRQSLQSEREHDSRGPMPPRCQVAADRQAGPQAATQLLGLHSREDDFGAHSALSSLLGRQTSLQVAREAAAAQQRALMQQQQQQAATSHPPVVADWQPGWQSAASPAQCTLSGCSSIGAVHEEHPGMQAAIEATAALQRTLQQQWSDNVTVAHRQQQRGEHVMAADSQGGLPEHGQQWSLFKHVAQDNHGTAAQPAHAARAQHQHPHHDYLAAAPATRLRVESPQLHAPATGSQTQHRTVRSTPADQAWQSAYSGTVHPRASWPARSQSPLPAAASRHRVVSPTIPSLQQPPRQNPVLGRLDPSTLQQLHSSLARQLDSSPPQQRTNNQQQQQQQRAFPRLADGGFQAQQHVGGSRHSQQRQQNGDDMQRQQYISNSRWRHPSMQQHQEPGWEGVQQRDE